MKTITINIEKTLEFSDEDINDLVSTALEGGITYWCGEAKVKEGSMSDEDYDKVEFISDVVSKGGVLILFDAESDDKWELTLEKMLNGIKKFCVENGYSDAEDLMSNYDANDADTIVQYAIFNELMFS